MKSTMAATTTQSPASTSKQVSKCPKTCNGKTCDYWATEEKYQCKTMEKAYGCDCTACECKVDKMIAACKEYKYKGDGNCDDGNNNAGCEFDGGDCCAKSVGGTVQKYYCKECKCLDPKFQK